MTSRTGCVLTSILFDFDRLLEPSWVENPPKIDLGGLLGPFGGLERLGGLLGASWEPLGASWGPLGRLLVANMAPS